MLPGTRSTTRAITENPEGAEVSVMWSVVMFRSFLYRLLGARDIVDIQIAAGAALQDLEEWAGVGQGMELKPDVDLV